MRQEPPDHSSISNFLMQKLHSHQQCKQSAIGIAAALISCACLNVSCSNSTTGRTSAAPNTISASEASAGWKLLWDGESSTGWRSAKTEKFPKNGWSMREGVLMTSENGGEESAGGGDIITPKRYANFELTADFTITPGANSGM